MVLRLAMPYRPFQVILSRQVMLKRVGRDKELLDLLMPQGWSQMFLAGRKQRWRQRRSRLQLRLRTARMLFSWLSPSQE
jgi:hypothetical protein